MTEIVKVHGLQELREALVRTVPDYMQGRVLQQSLAAGAKPIVQRARSLAPARTGRLRKAIYSTRDKKSRPTYEARMITVRSGKRLQQTNRDAFYWKFVEFGYHSRSGKAIPAQPFLRPAFEAQKQVALEAIKSQLKKSIETAAAKAYARRSYKAGSSSVSGVISLAENVFGFVE